MRPRRLLVGLGTAVTTALLVNLAGQRLLPSVVGAGFDVATLSLVLGILAGLVVGGLVAFETGLLSQVLRAGLVAYAVFGVVYVALWWAADVDLVGAASMLTGPVHLGASLALAVVAAVLVIRRRPDRPAASA